MHHRTHSQGTQMSKAQEVFCPDDIVGEDTHLLSKEYRILKCVSGFCPHMPGAPSEDVPSENQGMNKPEDRTGTNWIQQRAQRANTSRD